MRILISVLFAFFLSAGTALAEEQVDLTTPDQVRAGTSTYKVARLTLDFGNGYIYISLIGANGEEKTVTYERSAGGPALMRSLNRPGMQTKSLHRRIMEKLIADGHLVGSISGMPD